MTCVSAMLVATSYLVNPVNFCLFSARHCWPFKGYGQTCATAMWHGAASPLFLPATDDLLHIITSAPPMQLATLSFDSSVHRAKWHRGHLTVHKFRSVRCKMTRNIADVHKKKIFTIILQALLQVYLKCTWCQCWRLLSFIFETIVLTLTHLFLHLSHWLISETPCVNHRRIL